MPKTPVRMKIRPDSPLGRAVAAVPATPTPAPPEPPADPESLNRLKELDDAIEQARVEIKTRQAAYADLQSTLEAERLQDPMSFTEAQHNAQQAKLDAATRALSWAKERYADLQSLRPAKIDEALPAMAQKAAEDLQVIDEQARASFEKLCYAYNDLDASMLEFRRLFDAHEKTLRMLSQAARDIGRPAPKVPHSRFCVSMGDLCAILRTRTNLMINPGAAGVVTLPKEVTDLSLLLKPTKGDVA